MAPKRSGNPHGERTTRRRSRWFDAAAKPDAENETPALAIADGPRYHAVDMALVDRWTFVDAGRARASRAGDAAVRWAGSEGVRRQPGG